MLNSKTNTAHREAQSSEVNSSAENDDTIMMPTNGVSSINIEQLPKESIFLILSFLILTNPNFSNLKSLASVSCTLYAMVFEYAETTPLINYKVIKNEQTFHPNYDSKIQGLRLLNANTLVTYAPREAVEVFELSRTVTADQSAQNSSAEAEEKLEMFSSYNWDSTIGCFMMESAAEIDFSDQFSDDEFIAAVPISTENMLEISCDEQFYHIRIRNILNGGISKTVFTYPGNKNFHDVFPEATEVCDDICIQGKTSTLRFNTPQEQAEPEFQAITVFNSDGSLWETILQKISDRRVIHLGANGADDFLEKFGEENRSKPMYNTGQYKLEAAQLYSSTFAVWESTGLFHPRPGSGGGIRLYSSDMVKKITIRKARTKGPSDVNLSRIRVNPLPPKGSEGLLINTNPIDNTVQVQQYAQFKLSGGFFNDKETKRPPSPAEGFAEQKSDCFAAPRNI